MHKMTIAVSLVSAEKSEMILPNIRAHSSTYCILS